MPNDIDWIKAATAKARQGNNDVPNDVWTHLEALLTERFTQRLLPAGELAGIAMQLIDGMSPASTAIEEAK